MIHNQPLISVIVPIYNVQDYLEKCYNSIKNSSYKNLEIILVNDGSTDKCHEMCNAFQKSDSRVKVIDKPNGGLSSARNAGLDVANGEYICFIDSDDYITGDMIEKLVIKAEEYKADIVQCGYCRVSESGKVLNTVTSESVFLDSNKKILDAFFKDNIYHVVVWNKLYRKSVIANIRFIEGKNNEDNMFEADVFSCIKSVYIIKDACYMYLQRESSIMGGAFSHKKMDSFYALKYMLKRAEENYPDYISYIKKLICLNVFYLDYLIFRYRNGKEYTEDRDQLSLEFRENWNAVKNAGILIGFDKIRLNLYNHFPKLSFIVYSLCLSIKEMKQKLFSYNADRSVNE